MKIKYFILFIFLFLLYREIYSYKKTDNLVEIRINTQNILKIYYVKFSEKSNKNSFEIYDRYD